jgi:hypothetical protein
MNFNPQVWTLVRDNVPIKTCLVCADRVNFVGKLKKPPGDQPAQDEFKQIIHLVAIDLRYFETGKLHVGTFESEDGRWDIDTRLGNFFLTHETASAALEMAYRFVHPKTKIAPIDRNLKIVCNEDHAKQVSTKQNSSTIWKMKMYLCHVIWNRENLTVDQRIESLARQGHTGITEKAFTGAMERKGF